MLARPGDRIEQDMTWNGSMLALFGTATNHLSDTLRLNLGVRYSDEDKDADLFAQTYLVGSMYSEKKVVDSVASVIVTSTVMSLITVPVVVFYSLKYFQ